MKRLTTILSIIMFTNLSFAQCEDFEVEIEVMEPLCFGITNGNINLFIDGAEPYDVDITNADGEKENTGDSEYAWFIGAGWYYLYVEDDNGCIYSDSVLMNQPPQITVDLTITSATDFGECDGIVIADTVYNYQGDYESIFYDWCSGASGVGIFENTEVCDGLSCLIINDAHCMEMIHFEIGSLAGINSDNLSDILVFTNPQTGELNILNNKIQNAELTLFNLAGEVVFSSLINVESAVFTPTLETGIYLYTIHHNGENIQVGKLKF